MNRLLPLLALLLLSAPCLAQTPNSPGVPLPLPPDIGAGGFLPAGTYLLDGPLVMKDGASVTGAGPTLTHLRYSHTGVIYSAGSNERLENLSIVADAPNLTPCRTAGNTGGGRITGLTLRNVRWDAGAGLPFEFQCVDGLTLDHCSFHNSGTHGFLSTQYSTNVNLSGCTFRYYSGRLLCGESDNVRIGYCTLTWAGGSHDDCEGPGTPNVETGGIECSWVRGGAFVGCHLGVPKAQIPDQTHNDGEAILGQYWPHDYRPGPPVQHIRIIGDTVVNTHFGIQPAYDGGDDIWVINNTVIDAQGIALKADAVPGRPVERLTNCRVLNNRVSAPSGRGLAQILVIQVRDYRAVSGLGLCSGVVLSGNVVTPHVPTPGVAPYQQFGVHTEGVTDLSH